ncbi:HlyD family efflux transporter periplasmic adaptor subunit [Amycolatopsis sp. NBC_01307]|uniref:HlyD family efflux transporter periplasmic adaptor subunit n=1 Tax=Amycolatopsis sp. NBC_01307 TaxID=2903561 RepID=UPI002E0F243A|nr:HlyD family efflux transporter periplasmic adaptor subunit [Amycolatopsis sp. NBC_01307]
MSTTRSGGRRRWVWLVVTAVVVVLLGATAFFVVRHGRGTAVTAAPPPAVTTVAVRKTDLANTQSFTGTLGFGTPQPLKGTGAGTVTKLPAIGDVAQRGHALYSVDGRPVPVFFGDTPLFRKLDNPDLSGPDVTMVAANLAALGYKVGHPKTFTFADVLKKWQKKAGLDETGTLDVGQVAVLTGPVRVNSVTAQPGDPVAEPLLTVTSTTKVVVAPVDASDVAAIKTGAAVSVVRPDGKSVPAKVTSVSTDVAEGQGPPKVNVTVTPDDPQSVADLDSAAVQVRIATETHAGVLAVPVGALIALREGGYAVQLPDGTLKAVETGMFARDLVEVRGAGVAEGLKVVTTS